MVTDLILDVLTSGASFTIDLLPNLDLSIIPIVQIMAWLIQIFNTVDYVVPIKALLVPFFLWITIKNFHFGWKIIQRIWDALPLT
jgi:hypothetical protein